MNDALAGRMVPKIDQSRARHDRSRTLYFLAASVLAILIPLIFFAGFWIRSELNKSQRDLQSLLAAQATSLSQRIDGVVASQFHALQVVAALPALDDDFDVVRSEAVRIVGSMPDWSLIAVIEPGSGRLLMNTGQPPDAGPVVFPDQDLLRRLVQSRRPVVQSIEPGASVLSDQRSVLLYLPALRDNGVRWIMVAALKNERLQRVVAEPGTDRMLLSVVDERRHLLARSQRPEEYVGREAAAEFQRLVGTQESGIFDSETLDGQAVTTAFSRSPLTGWIAVTSMDRREFDRSSRQSVWATIVAGALSLTLAGILAVFLFHNVMEQRVSNERLSASRALGELDARLLATTHDALDEQRKAASEREVLLREIYHRVKNNLQIVQSLLRLGSRDLTREQREPFENAVRRIGAMARIHTLLYNSPDLASIDFKDYLNELVREARDSFAAEERGIATTLEAASMRVPLDTAVPLAFIAVEILTNAFRHAFPSGREGMITVSCDREGDHGVLIIADNGVGVPGSGPRKRSLGLTIAAKLAQQIGGHFEEPAPGESTFRLEFPLGAASDQRFDKPGSA